MKPYSSQCFVRATRGSRHRCLGALVTLLSTRLKLHDAGAPVAEGHLGVKRHLALFHTPVTQLPRMCSEAWVGSLSRVAMCGRICTQSQYLLQAAVVFAI